MPIEIRRMIFSLDELAAAMTGGFLPNGKVIASSVVEEAPLTIQVILQQDLGQQTTRTVSDEHLVDFMVSYFRENGIPMPRKAKKTVRLKDGNIVFDMAMRLGQAPSPSPSPSPPTSAKEAPDDSAVFEV